jgi:hypothetical protein
MDFLGELRLFLRSLAPGADMLGMVSLPGGRVDALGPATATPRSNRPPPPAGDRRP